MYWRDHLILLNREYIFLYLLTVRECYWIKLRYRHHQPTYQLNFISTATVFILHPLHITVRVPKTELGPLPIIGRSRGPFSPGTHPLPLQGPDSTDSKGLTANEVKVKSSRYLIYRFRKIIKLTYPFFPQCVVLVVCTIIKHTQQSHGWA